MAKTGKEFVQLMLKRDELMRKLDDTNRVRNARKRAKLMRKLVATEKAYAKVYRQVLKDLEAIGIIMDCQCDHCRKSNLRLVKGGRENSASAGGDCKPRTVSGAD